MLEQMEASTWLEKLVGNGSVGVVLKEISLEVHGGELMAILGSKGQFALLRCCRATVGGLAN